MRIPEFYPTRQGRPEIKGTKSLEGGVSLQVSSHSSLLEEYVQIKDILDKLLNEMIDYNQKMLTELQQVKLHLASMSGEDISEKDTGNEED